MGTFRPIKKWFIPLIAIITGTLVGLSFFPSHQEHKYNEWLEELEAFNKRSFTIETEYRKDRETVSYSSGYWSANRSTYHVTTPVSNDSIFEFDVFFEKEHFFTLAGGEWRQGEAPHRIIKELTPLDDFFSWGKLLLKEADKIEKKVKETKTLYKATFHSFDHMDFRGVTLNEQSQTTLIMTLEGGQLHSLNFEVKPIRPVGIDVLQSYPETMTYHIQFSPNDKQVPVVPEKALNSPLLE
ncbi:hypothetical protein [Halobacillus seohaensis]|uniref:Uncharacterized protein n=1 Tax=Halobacillus seohaensis TaxID=447421 RepID=A0ABW2EK08_9BACI